MATSARIEYGVCLRSAWKPNLILNICQGPNLHPEQWRFHRIATNDDKEIAYRITCPHGDLQINEDFELYASSKFKRPASTLCTAFPSSALWVLEDTNKLDLNHPRNR